MASTELTADTTGSGKADVNRRFGETAATGAAGGTGIALYQGALYAEINDRPIKMLSQSSLRSKALSREMRGGAPAGDCSMISKVGDS